MRHNWWMLAAAILGVMAPSVRAADPSPASDAQSKIDSMSATEKDDLRRRYERFERLNQDERERLRRLESDLVDDPQGDRLRKVMQRYHEWMSSLPSSQRAEILALPPEQRLEKIKNRLEEQENRRREELARQSINLEDISAIRAWMIPIFKRSENDLLAKLSPEQRRRCESVPESGRFGPVLGAAVWKQLSDNFQWRLITVMGITDAECEALVQRLSTTARVAYRNAPSDQDRQQLIESWMRHTIFVEMRRRPPQEWRKFADDPRGPKRMSDDLDYLPPWQMRSEFEGMFRERSKGGGPPGFPPYNYQKGDGRGRSEK